MPMAGGAYIVLREMVKAGYNMKKVITAFLLFDFVAGLLFLSFYGMRSKAVAADSGLMRIVDAEIEEDREVRKIAITFDDGPHPCYTEQLLDGLKERGIHATFFVTGDCVMILADWQNPVNKRVFVDLVLRKNAGCGVIFA